MRQYLRPLQAAWEGGQRGQTARKGGTLKADKMSLFAAHHKRLGSGRTTQARIASLQHTVSPLRATFPGLACCNAGPEREKE
jgi:hypothetical protein